MLSQIPIDLLKIKKSDLDNQILRHGMIAELDAVNFYEQMAGMTSNQKIKKVLLDVAREEKTHIAEFEILLLQKDKEQVKEIKHAKREIAELTKNR